MSGALELTLPKPAQAIAKFRFRFGYRGLMGAGLFLSALVLMRPVIQDSFNRWRSGDCKSQMKQIGLALANYHEAYGSFPPAYTVDADGNRLHSWRTLLLPFLDQKELYGRIDLSKSWDDPVNLAVAELSLECYRCPSSHMSGNQTSYQVVVGQMTCFTGSSAISYRDITDGTSNTISVVEASDHVAVPWMSPNDLDEKRFMEMIRGYEPNHESGNHALFADGAVRFIKSTIDPVTYVSLVTRYGDYFGCDF